MKRITIIVISAIVVATLIITGVVVHQNNNKKDQDIDASMIDSEVLLAPPVGYDDNQTLDFYNNNATQEEYRQFDEDGKEIIEDGYCTGYGYTTRVTTNRYSCYSTAASRCRYPCRVIVWTVGVTSDYRLRYQCQCL
jgi:hypothetical protein